MFITVHCSRCGFQAAVEEPLLESVKRSHAEWCDGQLEHADVEKLRKVYQAEEHDDPAWCLECKKDLAFCECECPTCGKNQFECECDTDCSCQIGAHIYCCTA